MHHEVTKAAVCMPVSGKAICRKCNGDRIKVVFFEKEGKKFAVCEDCGNVQSIGASLRDCYSKWKQYRESPEL